jgi:4-oxalocrotonate tautomerase
MPLVNVKLAAGAFTEKKKHDMTARLTDVMVAFEGSEAFRGWPPHRPSHR